MENEKYERLEDSPTGNMRFAKKVPDHGYMGGNYVATDGEASEEEISHMKERVVEEICNEIRRIAKKSEDFFIIKKGERFPGLDEQIVTTVGAKFILPTVKENYD